MKSPLGEALQGLRLHKCKPGSGEAAAGAEGRAQARMGA